MQTTVIDTEPIIASVVREFVVNGISKIEVSGENLCFTLYQSVAPIPGWSWGSNRRTDKVILIMPIKDVFRASMQAAAAARDASDPEPRH